MNLKFSVLLSLFVLQLSFSQTTKSLKGVVSYDGFLLQNIDVINKTSKDFAKTNDKGEFVIDAKASDSLFFYRKNFYLKRMKITQEELERNSLIVEMIIRPEELDEVVVERVEGISLKGSKTYEQDKINEYATQKFDNTEGHQAMRDGTFVNGLNFIAVAKIIAGLFIKEKETNVKALPENGFSTLAKKICQQKFFTHNLKLETEEIDLFLQFCDADPKSKNVLEQSNVLKMMDFLTIKNTEFQKLKNEFK